MNTLFLASQSIARQRLLKEASIPFAIIKQDSNETISDGKLPFCDILKSIALSKMEHAHIPLGIEGQECFVLTSDTMGKDINGNLHGKPINKQDAIEKLKSLKEGVCATAFCIEKKVFNNTTWITAQRILECVTAEYTFDVPDRWIERYLKSVPHYMQVSGAIDIEGYGAQFLKIVHGSYSTILGLPIYEVRAALESLNFY